MKDTPERRDHFWEQYERELRADIVRSCHSHARRLGHAVDPDDMVSWIDFRVWQLVETAPNPIICEGMDDEALLARIRSSLPMLTRWAYLAGVRKATRIRSREHGTDQAVIESIGQSQSCGRAIERQESVRSGLDALRSRVSADVRSKLAASWPAPCERERIADALDVNTNEDVELRERIEQGDLKENTVHQMRSRSQRRTRAIFEGSKDASWKFIPALLLAAVLAVAWAPNAHASDDDDDGEQTGGRSALTDGR